MTTTITTNGEGLTRTRGKRPYVKPTTELLLVEQGALLAGSVRNDGTLIMPDGTDSDKLGEGDGSDANAKGHTGGHDLWEE